VSQSLDAVGTERTRRSRQAGQELGAMLRQGRSFSGRERNCCFLNTGQGNQTSEVGRFANISAVSGIDFPDDARGLAQVDWDHDGDVDLWVSNRNAPRLRLLRNDAAVGNHYLSLRLLGDGTTTNRDAIGARIEVIAIDNESRRMSLTKTLRAGDAFLSQSSKWLHFGLGNSNSIEQVTVHWPCDNDDRRGVEVFHNLSVDGRYQLEQGRGKAVPQEPQTIELHQNSDEALVLPPSRTARIRTVTQLPIPALAYESFQGGQQHLPVGQGKPLLINLWASWCTPCMEELRELADRHQEIQQAGLDVVALAVDGLNSTDSNWGEAQRALRRMEFPFQAGQANTSLIAYLQKVHDQLMTLNLPLPVPMSFLVNQEGQVVCLYKGRLSINRLLEDATSTFQQTLDERFADAAPLTGQLLPMATPGPSLNEGRNIFQFALYLQDLNMMDAAAKEYRRLVGLYPEHVVAYNNLGALLAQQGHFDLAAAEFREAIRIRPNYADAQGNLGRLLLLEGRYREAKRHLQRALENNPNMPDVLVKLGFAYIQEKNWRLARRQFEEAIRLRPDNADAHAFLGGTLIQQGDLRAAERQILRALSIDPQHADARANLQLVRRLLKKQAQ